MKAFRLLLILCSGLLVNCASGPDHESVKNSAAMKPQNGKGLVLIYREAGLAGAGSKPFIWANGRKMPGQLARGGYYSYHTAPGPVEVVFSWRDHRPSTGEIIGQAIGGGVVGVILGQMGHEKIGVHLQVQSNAIHYVLMDGRKLTEVSKEEAEEALADCRWLNAVVP